MTSLRDILLRLGSCLVLVGPIACAPEPASMVDEVTLETSTGSGPHASASDGSTATDGSDTGLDTGTGTGTDTSASTSTGADTDTGSDTDTGEPPAEPASVLLRVITPDGTAIGKATVTVEGTPYFADDAGFVRFSGLAEGRFTARVAATGHTEGAVAIELSDGVAAYREVRLFPLGPAFPLDADAGGTVTHDGVSVEIGPGSLIDRFGQPVTGMAEVTITSLDPTTDELAALPGPLVAHDAQGDEVLLLTLAMAEISLWQDGDPLQLATGATATIELPLPPALAAGLVPGDVIPAWWLDLDGGRWREESTGTVVISDSDPGQLVWTAEVSHFTWYNCDIPANYQSFECYYLVVEDSDGNLLRKGFTLTDPAGVFVDGGNSTLSEANVVSNCALAPLGSHPVLGIAGISGFQYEVTEGTGAPNPCQMGGNPNPACAMVRVTLPPQAPPVICQPGTFAGCGYSGPPGTEDVGICQAGSSYCIDGGIAWSGCMGEVTPAPESCQTLYDDDCDGSISEPDAIDCDCEPGDSIPCYTGPLSTNGVGECTAGQRMCDPILQELDDQCIGQVTPQVEDCSSMADEDCDGLGGCTPPDAPELQLAPSQVKRLDFSWAPALGAQHYQLLESVDGEAQAEVGLPVLGLATSLVVPLHLRTNASYILRACNVFGCTDSEPLAVAGTLAEAVGYFKASNTDANDQFGSSVALSEDGNTLAVGAWFESSSATGIGSDQGDNSAFRAGAVYVFVSDGTGGWSQQAYIKASNTGANDRFGGRVALSGDGNTLAVSAGFEASNATGIGGDQADDSAPEAGAVYVFIRDGMGSWSQQAYVKASNTGAGDRFGHGMTLAADGNTLAVSAYWEGSNATGIDGNQADDSLFHAGAVYVFVRDGMGSWSQQAYLKASNTGWGDEFGYRVSLAGDGNTLAVGGRSESSNATGIDGNQDDNSATSAGAVYVFVRDVASVWSQQAYIKASNTNAYDSFGYGLELSRDGNTLAVGAFGEDGSATGIGGNEADDSANLAGAAYVFVRDGLGDWSQQAYVKASNTGVGDRFGRNLTLSTDGSILAVGASLEDSGAAGIDGDQLDDSVQDAGAVYVFVRDELQTWSQRAYVKAPNTGASDDFGASLTLTGDGNTLAIGAELESSSATGLGGNELDDAAPFAGAVYLY